jgi:hypothetical protein
MSDTEKKGATRSDASLNDVDVKIFKKKNHNVATTIGWLDFRPHFEPESCPQK